MADPTPTPAHPREGGDPDGLSAAPWSFHPAGTVYAADCEIVAVMGDPRDDCKPRHAIDGQLVAAAPQMLRALRRLHAIRPFNWDDGDDPELEAAWESCGDALALAGYPETTPHG